MSLDADIAIVGGGCSGLSLAVALSRFTPKLSVLTLEPRARYERDRTWCCWNAEPHAFSAAVTHRWDCWRVRYAGRQACQQSDRYQYEYIPADRFYQVATAALRAAGQTLCLSTHVQAVRQTGDVCTVETDHGSLTTRWVFDSRPPAPADMHPQLLQRFTGWHVRTARPCFDPHVVDLMDFQPPAEQGRTAFLYTLPFSTTEALVEATYLDHPALAPADAELLLHTHLQHLQAGQVQILYRETAALPMGMSPPARSARGRVHPIGARAGRIKASSGYAFLRIQRQSAAFAKALASGANAMPTTVEPAAYGVLDRVFLEAIRRCPQRAPAYFMAMFERLSPETLVRFLSETARPAEMLQVMLALPKMDFVRAALAAGKPA